MTRTGVRLVVIVLACVQVLATAGEVPGGWTRVVNLSVRVNARDASETLWDPSISPGGGMFGGVIFVSDVAPAAPDLILCLGDEKGGSYCYESGGGRHRPGAYVEDALSLDIPGARVPRGYFGLIVFDVDGGLIPPPMQFVLGTIVSPDPEPDYDRVQAVERTLQRLAVQHGVISLADTCRRDEDGKLTCEPVPAVPNQFAVKFLRDLGDCDSRDSLDPVCKLPSPSAGVVAIVDRASEGELRRDRFVACGLSLGFNASVVGRAATGESTEFVADGFKSRCNGSGLFEWNFGDGQVVTSPAGRVTHAFAKPGRYPVRVTFTCSGDVRTCFVSRELTVEVTS